MEKKTILVCFRQGTEADRQLEKELTRELSLYQIEPYFLYRTTMKAILEYLHSPKGFSCSHLLLGRSVLSESGSVVDLTVEDIQSLTDARPLHIAMVLGEADRQDTEFLISLYVNGITGAVFGKGRKGPVAAELAGCLAKGRTRREAREVYGIGIMPIRLKSLTYEGYLESLLYLEGRGPMGEKLMKLYQDLGLARMVGFLSRLPDRFMEGLAEDGDFLAFLDLLKKQGVVLSPGGDIKKRYLRKKRQEQEGFTDALPAETGCPVDEPEEYGDFAPPAETSTLFYRLFGFLFEDLPGEDDSDTMSPVEDEGPAFLKDRQQEQADIELSYEQMMKKLEEMLLT